MSDGLDVDGLRRSPIVFTHTMQDGLTVETVSQSFAGTGVALMSQGPIS